MASKLITTEAQLDSIITEGIKQRFAANIKKKLHEHIDPQIEEIANETASEVVSKVVSMNELLSNRVTLTVLFNDKKKQERNM